MAAWNTPPPPIGDPAADEGDGPLLGTLLRSGVRVRVAGTGLVMVADCLCSCFGCWTDPRCNSGTSFDWAGERTTGSADISVGCRRNGAL